MSFINPEPGDEAAGMLAAILALTDKLGVYPMESISEQLSASSGHLWLAKHERVWNQIASASDYTATDSIAKLVGNADAIDTIIDQLISVAMVILDLCEYTQSTIAMNRGLRQEGVLGTVAVLNTETSEAVEVGDRAFDYMRELTNIVIDERIQDYPMEIDHLISIVGAIRVMMILKEAAELPVAKRNANRDASLPIIERLFAEGTKIDSSDVGSRSPGLLDEDGNVRYRKQLDVESEEPIEDDSE